MADTVTYSGKQNTEAAASGALAGGLSGAAAGSVGGVPGAVIGALLGAAIGGATSAASDDTQQKAAVKQAHDAQVAETNAATDAAKNAKMLSAPRVDATIMASPSPYSAGTSYDTWHRSVWGN